MKKIGIFLLTLLVAINTFCPLQAENDFPAASVEQSNHKRPKIAVVLAGGGAKGMAHVTVLEALEDAGIPIDIVVGTSMGSIIGGLYAAGYSPEVMQQIISNTDWMQLILDNPDYGTGMMSSRMNMETYNIRMKMERARKAHKTGYGGLLEGENVLKLLDNLFADIPDSVDYNQLPIPFACVCTDLQTGEPYVMHSGNLATSIRTSMAIPSVFTPVIVNGRSYVDGGISNNFPVDVARQMGADIVIGLNMTRDLKYENLSNNTLEVLMQVMNLNGQEKTKENIKNADIYIPIDVNGYSAASFGSEAIDSLFQRGRDAVKPLEGKLKALHDQLNLPAYPDRIRIGEFAYDDNGHIIVHSTPEESEEDYQELAKKELTQLTRVFRSKHNNTKSAIGLGIRFDSYEYASILIDEDFVLNKKQNVNLNVKARLGNRMVFAGDLSTRTIGSLRFGLSYQYKFMNMDAHYAHRKNERIANFDMNENLAEAYFTREWRYFAWKGGIAYRDLRFSNSISVDANQNVNEKSHTLVPFLKLRFNNYNHQYFPTKGTNIELGIKLFTHNFTQTNDSTDYAEGDPGIDNELSSEEDNSNDQLLGENDAEDESDSETDEDTDTESDTWDYRPKKLARVHFSWQSAFSFGSRFTILPHASGNIYLNDLGMSDIEAQNTTYGGLGANLQFDDQLGFCGYKKLQIAGTDFVVGGVTLQQRIFKKHYILATIETAKEFFTDYETHKIETTKDMTGLSLSYNIMSASGPISLEGKWNDNTKKFALFFNMGYYF